MGTAILTVLGLALLAAIVIVGISSTATEMTLATTKLEAKEESHH